MIGWPKVQQALLTLLPTLSAWSGVIVQDGPFLAPPTDGEYVTVGAVDDEDGAGTWQQEQDGLDGFVAETGTVRCEIAVSTGADDLPAVRARAFVLADALDAALRADNTLGGQFGVDTEVTVSGDVVPVQNSSGTAVRLVLAVNYFIRSA